MFKRPLMTFDILETQRVQTAGSENASNLVPKHDPVEVNKYLMSGLTKSEIDSFFEGPPPDDRLLEFFRGRTGPLSSTIADAWKYINFGEAAHTSEVSWSSPYV
jgi:hypothetical protein